MSLGIVVCSQASEMKGARERETATAKATASCCVTLGSLLTSVVGVFKLFQSFAVDVQLRKERKGEKQRMGAWGCRPARPEIHQ